MADEAKAAEKSPSSLVGDVTKAIHEAWEFFLPATIRLIAVGLIVYVLGGKVLAGAFFSHVKSVLLSVNAKELADILEKYKLTSVAPIAALFLFSVCVYAFNRCVGAIGSLLPIQFTYSIPTLLFTRCGGKNVWYRLPETTSPDALVQTIDLELAIARAKGYGTLLDGVDYWSKRSAGSFSQAHFCKFLFLWSVGWSFALAHHADVPHGILVRLLGIFAVIAYWMIASLVMAAYSIEQTVFAKVSAAVALLTLDGKAELPADDVRRATIESSIAQAYPNRAWWWMEIGPLQWLHSVGDIDLRRLIWRTNRRN